MERPLVHLAVGRSADVTRQSCLSEQGDQSTTRVKRSDEATKGSSKQDSNGSMSVSEDSTTTLLSTAPLGTLTVSSVVSPGAMNTSQQKESMYVVGSSGEAPNRTIVARDPFTKREVPSQNEAAGIKRKKPSGDDLALRVAMRASTHHVTDQTGGNQIMAPVTAIAALALEPQHISSVPVPSKHPREAHVFPLDPQLSLCSYNSVYNQTFHHNPVYPTNLSINNPSHPNVSNSRLSSSFSGVPSFTQQPLPIRARSPEACWEVNPESTMHHNTALHSAPVSAQVLLDSSRCDINCRISQFSRSLLVLLASCRCDVNCRLCEFSTSLLVLLPVGVM